jgi:hypothetical protein
MEKWRNGEMAKWWNGEMVKWRNGEMVKWWNGKMVKWWNGELVKWRNGEMVKWRNGKMVKWWTGKMAKWWNGEMAVNMLLENVWDKNLWGYFHFQLRHQLKCSSRLCWCLTESGQISLVNSNHWTVNKTQWWRKRVSIMNRKEESKQKEKEIPLNRLIAILQMHCLGWR